MSCQWLPLSLEYSSITARASQLLMLSPPCLGAEVIWQPVCSSGFYTRGPTHLSQMSSAFRKNDGCCAIGHPFLGVGGSFTAITCRSENYLILCAPWKGILSSISLKLRFRQLRSILIQHIHRSYNWPKDLKIDWDCQIDCHWISTKSGASSQSHK